MLSADFLKIFLGPNNEHLRELDRINNSIILQLSRCCSDSKSDHENGSQFAKTSWRIS